MDLKFDPKKPAMRLAARALDMSRTGQIFMVTTSQFATIEKTTVKYD